MAKFRETPCKFYVCKGECEKNRTAEYKGYCQKCDKYTPRIKEKIKNRKRDYNEKIRSKIGDELLDGRI